MFRVRPILRHGAAAAALLAVAILSAQLAKKPLEHSVYDGWKSARFGELSRDGAWVSFVVSPQSGDGELLVRATRGETVHRVARGTGPRFTYDGSFLLATIAPPKEDVDKAKKEKKPAKDQPKNALGILSLSDGKLATIERVRSWRLPAKGSRWLAYQLEEPPTPEKKPEEKPAEPKPPAAGGQTEPSRANPNQPAPGAQETKKEEKPQKKKDHAAGSELILREITTGKETKLADVADYQFSEEGATLVFAVSTKSGEGDGLFWLDLASESKSTVLAGLGRYQQISIHKSGKKAAFVTDRDDYKSEQPSPSLYLYSPGDKEPKLLAKAGSPGLPAENWVSARGTVRFSENGERVYFGFAPKPEPESKDETPEDEKVVVDVWHYRDAPLMSVQVLQAASERNRTYDAAVHLDTGKIVSLEDKSLPNVTVGARGNADYGIANTSVPYGVEASWNPGNNDVYLVSVRDGVRTRILQKLPGGAQMSPGGKYVAWYDGRTKAYYAREIGGVRIVNLTEKMPHPIHDEDDDHPDYPGPYGSAGWLEGDEGVLIYDRFDIWLCDPTGKKAPTCVTAGHGRMRGVVFRRIDLDRENDFIPKDENLLLLATDERSKATGFWRRSLKGNGAPEKRVMDHKIYSFLGKAEAGDTVAFTCQDFVEYPDICVSDLTFGEIRKVSDANPQQAEFNWGRSELVEWVSSEGATLQGVLVKPEDFDPAKKYPMIVYFYERMSDQVHRHRVPAPSASTINPTVYASNGYLVFMPDIPYKVGYPGESAVHAILPGVSSLISRGYVDSKRIGIQGQSWGGYQVAYLVTRTNMFAAACAGAPVSNMFSAYGGIRWGSGLVRQMQYEHGQSRIGGSIWERPLQYLENSPVFWADKVNTPLLMMHNDNDGAVPWYQGIEYFVALRRLEKPVWMCVYNNEDHNLTKRPNQKDWAVRMQQFFDHYLKGAPMPAWMSEGVPAVKKGKTLGLELPGEKKPGG